MASEAKQENNRSDPDVVRLGPKFAPGTWFWQEAPAPARKGARAKPPRWVQDTIPIGVCYAGCMFVCGNARVSLAT